MKILIPTCNKYIHYVEALQHSVKNTALRKYDFIIIGDQKPKFELDKNWSFVSIGQDEPATRWSTRMRMFLETFPDEEFIYGCDDCAVTFIDEKRLQQSVSMFKWFRGIGRIALMAEGRKRPMSQRQFIWKESGYNEYSDMSQFDEDSDYRLSLGWSIYNKECFLQFCEEGMTPWDFETQSCGQKNKERLDKWAFLTFLPHGEVIDGAFFARKHTVGVIKDWHKGYYGHDLTGKMKDEIEQILFKQ